MEFGGRQWNRWDSRRIGIAKDANAGKTVLSRRLTAFLAGPKAIAELFSGQPPPILRWENGPRDKSMPWPQVDHEGHLLSLLGNALRKVVQSPVEDEEINDMMDDLLEQGRVAIVLRSVSLSEPQGARDVLI